MSKINAQYSAVTAVYQGSPRGTPPVLLRSYDSRREPPPEFDCKIWQAGRATSAVGLAFKPVRIGQSIFHDDGAGAFNPAPEALDEAVVNEWPGRDIGVFISVGTGRRPKSSDSNQAVWYEGFLGDFAEARRRLIAKIEGCEKIHEYMVREHLSRRGVNVENYYRLNVEVGVGEFGMNEWHRLGDISTSTRRYMARESEQKMIQGISTKLAKILRAKVRWERAQQDVPDVVKATSVMESEMPLAVELPGDMPSSFPPPPPPQTRSPLSRTSFDSGSDTLPVGSNQLTSPRASHDRIRPGTGSSRLASDNPDRLVVSAPSPNQYKNASDAGKFAILSLDEHPRPPPQQTVPPPTRLEPPPLPPKTPLAESDHRYRPAHSSHNSRVSESSIPPYPLDDDESPPPVNMARKPGHWAH